MRKITFLALITVLSLNLTGCLPKSDETQTAGEAATPEPAISEDSSLETIKEELEETEVEDETEDWEELDKEIKQL